MEDLHRTYPDHLIDGDPGTYWKAATFHTPQWIEVRWPVPQKVDGVTLHPLPPSQPQQWRVEAMKGGEWVLVAKGEATTAISFPPIRAERLRLWFDRVANAPLAMTEVEVHGVLSPSSAMLQPYWTAQYIWHPEPERKLDIGAARYFRTTFEVSDPVTLSRAVVQSRSNDHYHLYLNGEKVASGSKAITPVSVLEHLRKGENVLAYEAKAGSDPGWGLMVLLGEMTLVDREGSRRQIGTGPEWHSSTTADPGWNAPGFEPGKGWQPVAVLGKPPAEPWGRIPYRSIGSQTAVTLQSLGATPDPVAPGATLEVSATVVAPEKLAKAYAFEFRLADDPYPDFQDYHLVSAAALPEVPTQNWTPGEAYTLRASLPIPSWAPPGATLQLSLRALSLDGSGDALRWEPKSAPVTITAPKTPPMPMSKKPWTIRAVQQGALAHFELNGQPLAPVFWGGGNTYSYEKIAEYAKTGNRIFEVSSYPSKVESGVDYRAVHFQSLDQNIRNILRLVPDAAIMIKSDVRASGRFRQEHPEAMMIDAHGRNLGIESMSSSLYRAAVRDYVRQLMDYLSGQPYASRIVGYRMFIGPQADAYIGGIAENRFQDDRSKLTIGDYHPEALEAFRRFLRGKYEKESALQEAWKMPQVTFENALPDAGVITAAQPDHQLFRDPRAGRMPADYAEFLSGLIPGAVEELVAEIVHEREGVFVSSWTGYFAELLRGLHPASSQQLNGFRLAQQRYRSSIDLFTGTTNYSSRRPGVRTAAFQPFTSIAWNRKLAMIEIDYRTFLAGTRTRGRHKSQDETSSVLRREMGTALIHGAGYYFYEFPGRSGRDAMGYFMDRSILGDIRRSTELFNKAMALETPPRRRTEVAVVLSAESVWHQDVAYPAGIYQSLIPGVLYHELSTLGAPVDLINVNDLELPEVRDQYKLFLFLNPFYLTDQQRGNIEALKGEGRTLAFFYASGYVSDSEGLSVASMKALTGLELEVIEGREVPRYHFNRVQHPLLAGVRPGQKVEVPPVQEVLTKVVPQAVFPNFHVSDAEALALGSDEEGRTRLAWREFDSWKVLYSAVPNAPAALLRQLATAAGVHLYCEESGVVVEANDRYLLLHWAGDRATRVNIRLPYPATVHAHYRDQPVATEGERFEVELPSHPFTEIYELTPLRQ